MKKIKSLFILLSSIVLSLGLVACGNNNTEQNGGSIEPTPPITGESNILVTYFSWSSSGNTQTMANMISEFTGGELYRIIPETPYTTNYNEVLDVAQEEKANNARPLIQDNLTQDQIDEYDVIFVGYPVWWYDAPMIIYSFLEANDFSDKIVVTFATSGGSGISDSNLRSAIDANFISGLCISNISSSSSSSRVENWITDLGYHL